MAVIPCKEQSDVFAGRYPQRLVRQHEPRACHGPCCRRCRIRDQEGVAPAEYVRCEKILERQYFTSRQEPSATHHEIDHSSIQGDAAFGQESRTVSLRPPCRTSNLVNLDLNLSTSGILRHTTSIMAACDASHAKFAECQSGLGEMVFIRTCGLAHRIRAT
jgi:hypothetical protein